MFLCIFLFSRMIMNHSNLSEKLRQVEENQNLSQFEITPIIQKVIQMGGMRMGEREAYEVLRLIEHNQKCYISSDYVEGKSLIQWLKYREPYKKKQLFYGSVILRINWSAYISAGETLVTSM